jgi:hypothetical protein
MNDSVSIEALLAAIHTLPADAPVHHPKRWYRTQKEHWIGWLSQYHGPGAYGRKTEIKRDARFAYNHIVEPEMLLWLIDAAGVDRTLVAASRQAAERGTTLMQKSATIRKLVPWEMVAVALWPAGAAKIHSGWRKWLFWFAPAWTWFGRRGGGRRSSG